MKERRAWLVILPLVVAAAIGLSFYGCHRHTRLVEQFDNGPVGGHAGPSEGYYWVGEDDHPTPGKNWKPIDPKSLSPEQRARIRN